MATLYTFTSLAKSYGPVVKQLREICCFVDLIGLTFYMPFFLSISFFSFFILPLPPTPPFCFCLFLGTKKFFFSFGRQPQKHPRSLTSLQVTYYDHKIYLVLIGEYFFVRT
jgi:uncharacterized membrane protein (DUF485 family)